MDSADKTAAKQVGQVSGDSGESPAVHREDHHRGGVEFVDVELVSKRGDKPRPRGRDRRRSPRGDERRPQ